MCYPDEYSDEEYKIRFDRMNSRRAYGKFEDHDVYVDSYSGIRVQYGDVWYCNLARMDGNHGNHYYFANPVSKVEDRNGSLVDTTTPETRMSESTADAPEKETAIAIENDDIRNEFIPELSGFVAIGDDTIYSPRLTAARYTVYRSFNGEHFEIIPDANGNIPCVRNSIALESLDDILDCEFPARLDCTMKDGRILLNLTQ